MEDIEIKPCPFCGDTPKITRTFFIFRYIQCWYWKCVIHPSTRVDVNIKTIIDIWNTRDNKPK